MASKSTDASAKPKLTIITPCSRPANLRTVAASIDFDAIDRWIIVHDTTRVPKPAPQFTDNPKVVETDCDDAGISGNAQRNKGIDMVPEGPAEDAGYVYFLDDDNVVHPNFFHKIVPLLDGTTAIVTFDMVYSHGTILAGNRPNVFKIDTAMFVALRSAIGAIRWQPQFYHSDGLFVEALMGRVGAAAGIAKHWKYVNIPAAFYNRIA